MEKPLISIIVPVYKVEDYLDECVRSIVNQTYEKIEIILVDDGSPDRCPEICDKWVLKDSRIRVIHKKNEGLSSARNSGLDTAQGSYIGFVDSDDFIHPQMYEKMLGAIEASDKKMAYCSWIRAFPDGTQTKIESCLPKGTMDMREAMDAVFLDQINVSVWSKLYHRSIFEHLRFPVGENNEDLPLIIPTVFEARGIANTGESLYYYRERENSITSSYWKTDMGIVLKHLREMQEQIKAYGLEDTKSFRFFLGKSAYFTSMFLDKNYHRINDNAKRNHVQYLSIMRKNYWHYVPSKRVKLKDKLLYTMIVTRTMRPIYKILGKQ